MYQYTQYHSARYIYICDISSYTTGTTTKLAIKYKLISLTKMASGKKNVLLLGATGKLGERK